MENQNNRLPEEQQNEQNKDLSQDQGEQHNTPNRRNVKGGNAANIDSIISSATDNVRSRHRHTSDWTNTGTNTSYEGASTTLGGGAAGTGYTSGQSGVGARIHTDSDYDKARVGHSNTKQDRDEDLDPDLNERNDQTKDII
jgi:hypothetical protein